MATESLKTLGQLKAPATTLSDLYVVPAATSASVSTLVVANQSASSASFRVSVAKAGAADDPKQYLVYDLVIDGNDVFAATIGISLAATDVVRVYASSADLSFNIFGAEIS